MTKSFASASLYVIGDHLLPDDVTAMLGLAPTNVYKKGALKVPGRSDSAKYPTTMWIRSESSETSSASVLFEDILRSIPHGICIRDIDGVDDAFVDVFFAQAVPETDLNRAIDFEIEFHKAKLLAALGLSTKISFCNVSDQ
ncbi:DUF4279 domain-containing protein [Luteibacter rhizovicinus]|uniref:DUF4279 domain-containing protein n=1 Tax=Luteibacter rhizovicinus TaxID=242606 RepID=UPI00104556E1|nr:DUF4279 domain-containing protein [Luteibacter rhizovicinus]